MAPTGTETNTGLASGSPWPLSFVMSGTRLPFQANLDGSPVRLVGGTYTLTAAATQTKDGTA